MILCDGTLNFVCTLGCNYNYVCLIVCTVPDNYIFSFQFIDFVIKIRKRYSCFKTYLLSCQCIIVAGAYYVLSDFALHELPKLIRSLSAVHWNKGFGIVAEFSEISFHIHSFFQYFS